MAFQEEVRHCGWTRGFQSHVPFSVHFLCLLLVIRDVSSQLFLPSFAGLSGTLSCSDGGRLLTLWNCKLMVTVLITAIKKSLIHFMS